MTQIKPISFVGVAHTIVFKCVFGFYSIACKYRRPWFQRIFIGVAGLVVSYVVDVAGWAHHPTQAHAPSRTRRPFDLSADPPNTANGTSRFPRMNQKAATARRG